MNPPEYLLKKRRFPIRLLFASVLICLISVSCDIDDRVEYLMEGCDESGAHNLRENHRQVLAYAGWLDYVKNHVGTIIYHDDMSVSSEGLLGLAVCQPGECRIEIATKGRSELDIVRTIVHEAGHLEDDCKHGETLAVSRETAFLEDFHAKADSGELIRTDPAVTVRELFFPDPVIDFHPHPGSSRIALILANDSEWEIEPQTDLYLYDADTDDLESVSDMAHVEAEYGFANASLTFPRPYHFVSGPLYARTLKNPWSPDGSAVAVCLRADGQAVYAGFADLTDHHFYPLDSAADYTGVIFSPDGGLLAVASAGGEDPIRIFRTAIEDPDNPMPETPFYTLPRSYGGMAWMDDGILAVYQEEAGTIDAYDIAAGTGEPMYAPGDDRLSLTGMYAYGETYKSFFAVFSGYSGYRRMIQFAQGASPRVVLENIALSMPPDIGPKGWKTAYYNTATGNFDDSGEQLFLMDLMTGENRALLDRFTEKGRVFFLDENRLLVSTVRKHPGKFTYEYRLWVVTPGE